MHMLDQKVKADRIMYQMKLIDPNALLAGGAPRDWYFGNPCNDLDIYYYSSGMTVGSCKRQLESLFPDVEITHLAEQRLPSEEPMYASMPFLKRIFEATIGGIRVQFIQLETNGKQFKVVDNMDVSICQCWYNHKQRRVELHKNFKLTLATKMMFLPNGNSWSDKHPAKMAERFSNKFSCETEEQARDKLVRVALRDFD